MTDRPCSKCQLLKPETEFYARTRGGVETGCKGCRRLQRNESYRRNRIHARKAQRAYSIEHRHGISEEEYDRLHQKAKQQCPICGFKGKLHLDHNHKTGVIREFVCPNCNKALGLLNEDPERMERMIAYVRKHERGVI